jgi:hypothetical protein
MSALAFLSGLSHRRIDRLLRNVKIAFAAAVPVDLVNLRVIFHSPYNVMKMVFSAGYRSASSGRPLILLTIDLR